MFVCAECGQRHDQPGYCPADGRPLVATDDPLLGTEVGRYRLASLLGEGGMGRVYLGVQPAIGSRVAVKILSDQCARDPALLERFFAEAKAVNLIRHESIVSVLDLSRLDDGRPYIVMEYVEGHVLGALIHGAPAPLGGLVQVFTEVLSALEAAHAIGIVHRDLKPDNIIVTGEGHAKVLDFGIAKLAPGLSHLSPRTATGALLGTPAYMAPEQIGGGTIDPRTDVYAIGIVMYEAITGRVPFAGETLFDLMRQHLEMPPVPPSRLRADLPPELEHVILTALEKNPARRFQTALAMAEATSHAASVLAPDQWRALVRGGVITGGPASMSKMIPPSGRRLVPGGRPRGDNPFAQPASLAHDRTEVASPRSPGSPRARAQPSSSPPLGSPFERPSEPYTPHDRPSEPARFVIDPASASQTRLAPENRPKKRWPIVIAILGSAAIAITITITLFAIRGSSDAHPPANPPIAEATSAPSAPLPAGAPVPRSVPPIIVGSGSAADHGVYIGPNVIIGSNTKKPPTQQTGVIDFDPTKFDPISYLPKAKALAKRIYPDVEFTELEFYENVLPDGTVDLTLKSSSSSYYEFRSASHSVFPKTRNATNDDIPCYVMVDVTATGITTRVREDDECDHPLRAAPRCTFAEVWKLSRTKDTIPATIGFLHDGTWFFDHDHAGKRFDTATTTSFKDCR